MNRTNSAIFWQYNYGLTCWSEITYKPQWNEIPRWRKRGVLWFTHPTIQGKYQVKISYLTIQ